MWVKKTEQEKYIWSQLFLSFSFSLKTQLKKISQEGNFSSWEEQTKLSIDLKNHALLRTAGNGAPLDLTVKEKLKPRYLMVS